MLGTELAIFIVIGAVAILAAVMMLISENAVHSALFLIVNFASVAFLYLMLSASFLAMVQVAVYAGAIMVLFLFVIMLLGAERLLPEGDKPFQWLTPLVVGVTVTILFIASIAILQSEIDSTEPQGDNPVVRIVHANSELGALEVHIGDEVISDELGFTEGSEFIEFDEGEYPLTVTLSNDETPLFTETVFLNPDDVATLVIVPQPIDDSPILRVDTSLDAIEDMGISHLTVVHVADCPNSCIVDIADNTDTTQAPIIFVEDVDYGDVTEVQVLRRDQYDSHEYTIGAYSPETLQTAIDSDETPDALLKISDVEIENNHSLLWIITSDTRATAFRTSDILLNDANKAVFGSAEGIGQKLFTTYLLPFEMMALLLLVAMIGAIILTKDTDARVVRRFPRRMAAVKGNPTVADYVKAIQSGETPALPDSPSVPQLPEGSGD